MANPYAGIPNGYPNNANMQQYQQYPQNIPNVQQPAPVQTVQQPTAQLIPLSQMVGAWVPNPDIAQRMFVEPNKIAIMFNEAEGELYVKTTDNIGRQSEMRTYKDVTPPAEVPQVDLSGYVTKQDFSDLAARFGDLEDKISRLFDSVAPKKRVKREDADNEE